MNYEEYLKRIQFDGSLDTTSSILKKLSDCHLKTVPFETFDMFGGERKILSLEKVYNDIVVKKRGGFCYENNGLFCWLLRELGFEVVIMQAQMYIHSQQIFSPEFGHMTMMVTCRDSANKWIADVGMDFNKFSSLKFIEMEEQVLKSGVYRIRKSDNDDHTPSYVIERVLKVVLKEPNRCYDKAQRDEWKYVYKFTLTPRKWEDFEPMCNIFQDDALSFLRNNALSAKETDDGVVITWGQTFCWKKYIDPYTEEVVRVVKTNEEDEFKKMLEEEMGIVLDFPLALKAEDFKGFG